MNQPNNYRSGLGRARRFTGQNDTTLTLLEGDCLDLLPRLGLTVDLVLTDPPYGTTQCKWDSVIPLPAMWDAIWGVTKPNAAVVFFCAQPFTSVLGASCIDKLRYDLVWTKTHATGFLNANRMQLRAHEDILVFYLSLPTYHPQKTGGRQPYSVTRRRPSELLRYQGSGHLTDNKDGTRHPLSWRTFKKDRPVYHPTQKPVALLEYLIQSYTNPGELVLDFTMGSGSTGVACANTGRSFVGIELTPKYFDVATQRVQEAIQR